MTIGSYLKESRQKSGKTMQNIATALKLSVSYVSQVENGDRLPSPKQFSSLAKAYGLKEEQLKEHWFDSKLSRVVGMATTYKFKIEDAMQRKTEETLKPVQDELNALKASLAPMCQVPLLAAAPSSRRALSSQIKRARAFVFFSKVELHLPIGHRLFAIKAHDVQSPQLGVMHSDFLVFDPDATPSVGDLVLLATPTGLILNYFNVRNGNLELPINSRGQTPFISLKQVEVLGRVIYHVRKF